MEEKKEEMEAVNRFTRRTLTEDDVYIFSVVLCDNEIDRDYERFSDESLEKLSELFVGVTGIADHDPKSSNQSARIFSCCVETAEDRETSDGRPYRRLCARAYLPKSQKTEELILALDSGIKKEVSVGCAVKQRICSICGEDISVCQHIRGKRYDNRLCYATLDEPTDAYEWSFVAVPAQKEAGVIKGFSPSAETIFNKSVRTGSQGGYRMEVEKKLLAGGEQHFTAAEMQELAKSYRLLQEKAADGEMVRDKVIKELRSLAAVVLP